MADEGRGRERELSHNRKRRGVARASITRLENRVSDLEAKPELDAGDRAMALQLTRRLSDLDAEFKRHHFSIIDLVDETAVDGEQNALDDHSLDVSTPTTHGGHKTMPILDATPIDIRPGRASPCL